MLTRLGNSTVERAKSVTVAVLATLLATSLWQLSVGQAQAQQGKRDTSAMSAVAERFAVALMTYDYAHPEVLYSQIGAVRSSAIDRRIRAAFVDIASARVSSVGEVTESYLTSVTASEARVLERTAQVVSAQYMAANIQLFGLLDVTVTRSTQGRLVSDYQWLLAPVAAP